MAGVMLLGVYLYPTIMRFVDLSFRLEKLGDIGAFVDEQVARVEGQLKGVTERVEARVDELGGKLEGVSGRLNGQLNNIDKRVAGITSRLDGQITNVEERLDNMFETIEEKLRSLFKLKLGQTDGAMD
jgi:chromosome segregation ATPase